MWASFGDMTNHSGPQLNAAAFEAQEAASLNYITDDVFIAMIDLFSACDLLLAEGNKAAGELLRFKTVPVADLPIDLPEMFERLAEIEHATLFMTSRVTSGMAHGALPLSGRPSLRDSGDNLTDRLLGPIVGHAARADDFVAAAAVAL